MSETTKPEVLTMNQELIEKGRQIVLNAPQLYIDVDIEADGIAGHGSMLAIGAQSPTGESFYSEIRPASQDFIAGNRDFCEDHGLQRERLQAEAPEFTEVMTKFNEWIKGLEQAAGKPSVMSAFFAAFDWSFVDLYFAKANITNPFGHHTLDLKSLALTLDQKWDWDRASKSRLPSSILPEGEFSHNALEDAQYQQIVHFGLAALIAEAKLTTA